MTFAFMITRCPLPKSPAWHPENLNKRRSESRLKTRGAFVVGAIQIESPRVRVDFGTAPGKLRTMTFCRIKLLLALAITGVGMVVASVWNAWQDLGLHHVYPFDTFFYAPGHRFEDLTEIVGYASLPSPYQSIWGGYPPTSYNFARLFSVLSPAVGTFLFLSIGSLGLAALTFILLEPVVYDRQKVVASECFAVLIAMGLTFFSYPLLFALDRANIELMMALSVALALFCFRTGRHSLGMICLFPAICCKLYPGLLLVLYFRPRYIQKVILVGVMVVVTNLVSLDCYSGGFAQNWALWHRNLNLMNDYYIIKDGQLHGSASLWNTIKALLETLSYLGAGRPDGVHMTLPHHFLEKCYSLYAYLSLATIAAVGVYCVFVEQEFFRRAIVLLLIMTLCVPSGGDYRLLYAEMAMAVLIVLPGRRRHDLLIVGLLAFAIAPKKELILSFTGICDAGVSDTSIATILNPPCLLAALGLLMHGGWKDHAVRFWRQKVSRFFKQSGSVLTSIPA